MNIDAIHRRAGGLIDERQEPVPVRPTGILEFIEQPVVDPRVQPEIHGLAPEAGVLVAGPVAHQEFHVVETEKTLAAEAFGAECIEHGDHLAHGPGPEEGGGEFAVRGEVHHVAQAPRPVGPPMVNSL